MTPEDLEKQGVRDMESLRGLPSFERVVLAPMREEFHDAIHELANCSSCDIDKVRGVLSYIATAYENLSGKPITSPGQQDKGKEAGPEVVTGPVSPRPNAIGTL